MERNIKEVMTELIPDECYIVEYNADKSTKVTCKNCSKVFKSEKNVKQHIRAVHKSLKRLTDSEENSSLDQTKKNLKVAEEESGLKESTSANLDTTEALCDEILSEEAVVNHSFSLDESVENLVNRVSQKPMNSTSIWTMIHMVDIILIKTMTFYYTMIKEKTRKLTFSRLK